MKYEPCQIHGNQKCAHPSCSGEIIHDHRFAMVVEKKIGDYNRSTRIEYVTKVMCECGEIKEL